MARPIISENTVNLPIPPRMTLRFIRSLSLLLASKKSSSSLLGVALPLLNTGPTSLSAPKFAHLKTFRGKWFFEQCSHQRNDREYNTWLCDRIMVILALFQKCRNSLLQYDEEVRYTSAKTISDELRKKKTKDMSAQPAPLEVFYSYADADEDLCIELDKHLSQLRHDGLIAAFHKRQITAGQDWTKVLDQHLSTASVILLLVSADFLASDYCYGVEMMRAMQRHRANEARVIPLLLRPCDWQSTPFGHLEALPKRFYPSNVNRS